MTAVSEVAALVVDKAQSANVELADAVAFAEVEIGNVVRAEIEQARQVDRADLTGKLALAQARLAATEAELAELKEAPAPAP